TSSSDSVSLLVRASFASREGDSAGPEASASIGVNNDAKYQQHLNAEYGKLIEGGATYSSKATKVTKPKAAKATKPASDPKRKPTLTQPPKAFPEKKQKLVQETPDEPSPAKRSKGGRVRKICKPMSSLKLVDKPSAEDVLVEEPAYNEEEANLQRALELILKEQAEQTQRPARPVVIREPDSRRIQPLPETPKNKSFVDQFIFQRRTPMLAEASGPAESPSLDAELALTNSETESDDEVPKINTGDQDCGSFDSCRSLSLILIDVLVEEPAYNEEEANLQRALELSLKEQAERTQRPAHPVVIREPDSRRIQPLLEDVSKHYSGLNPSCCCCLTNLSSSKDTSLSSSTFLSLLRNLDREDLEVLWQLVKEIFASSKPKNFSDDFLLSTLTYMFEKPDVEA
nr:hypothetical protein [Tanacetum cinerariifolium]